MDDDQIGALKALDHHATAETLDRAVYHRLGKMLSQELATNLGRAGYALVRIGAGPDFITRQGD